MCGNKSNFLYSPRHFVLKPSLFLKALFIQFAIFSEDYSDLDSFCILGEEEGSGIIPSSGEPTIKVELLVEERPLMHVVISLFAFSVVAVHNGLFGDTSYPSFPPIFVSLAVFFPIGWDFCKY